MLNVYRAVISSLLYSMHARVGLLPTTYKETQSYPSVLFSQAHKNKWQDKIPDTEVIGQIDMSSVYTMLRISQLRCRWAGHITRTPNEHFPMVNCRLAHAPNSYIKDLYSVTRMSHSADLDRPFVQINHQRHLSA